MQFYSRLTPSLKKNDVKNNNFCNDTDNIKEFRKHQNSESQLKCKKKKLTTSDVMDWLGTSFVLSTPLTGVSMGGGGGRSSVSGNGGTNLQLSSGSSFPSVNESNIRDITDTSKQKVLVGPKTFRVYSKLPLYQT